MIIEKFIQTYAEQEIEKLKRIAEKQGLSDWTQLDFNQFGPRKHHLNLFQNLPTKDHQPEAALQGRSSMDLPDPRP